MCYTGKCPYENHDNYECTLPWGTAAKPPIYPDDARCMLMEVAQELEAAGLLGDIDIDDPEAITAAFGRMQDALGKPDLEEAVGELVGFEPGMVTKGLRSAIDVLKEDTCKSA